MSIDGEPLLSMLGEAPGPFSWIGNEDYPADADRQLILSIIARDRNSDAFYDWVDGFSPKEHFEMRESQRRLSWEAETKRTDRRWRIAELLMFIVAGASTAIIAALIERGKLFGNGQPPMP